MPRIVKVNNVKMICFTPKEMDRFPNVCLGRNCTIRTNRILEQDPRLNKYINDETMGVLDNYAKHENMNICITPLENDLFDDIIVSVYKENLSKEFPMKIAEGKDGLAVFLRELYKKILTETNADTTPKFVKPEKKSILEEAKMYFQDVISRFQEMRLEKIKNFVEKHHNENNLRGIIADGLEEVNFGSIN